MLGLVAARGLEQAMAVAARPTVPAIPNKRRRVSISGHSFGKLIRGVPMDGHDT